MLRDRSGCGYGTMLALVIGAGCAPVDARGQRVARDAPVAGAPAVTASALQPLAAPYSALAAARQQARLQPTPPEADATPSAPAAASGPSTDPSLPPTAAYALAAGASGSSVRPPLPDSSARTVLHEEINEAENLLFTDDGRLFVTGGEDIYEITQVSDGTFTKTDYFHENCLVEGIVSSGQHLYSVCTLEDDSLRALLFAAPLSAQPQFRQIAELEPGSAPNGMTVDPEGHIYITYWLTHRIVRVTLASPLEVERTDIWSDGILLANGIKYQDHAIYLTMLDATLVSRFLRIPVLPDGSAGRPQQLYRRALTLFDDIVAFDDGFIITDFVNGTLIFWNERRGVYAETPVGTFFGPSALAPGQPPMFSERQLIVTEKGAFLVRDEKDGDLLSMYQLP